MSFAWASWKFWAKGLGLIFLVIYFWYHPPYVEAAWVAVYVGLAFGVGFFFTLVVNPILVRFLPTQKTEFSSIGLRRITQAKRRPFVEALLIPGEDGLFFVPLLLIGANWLSICITALAFGSLHYPEFPLALCVVKAVFVALIAVLILPHGLGTVVTGHLIVDALAYFVWRSSPSPATSANE